LGAPHHSPVKPSIFSGFFCSPFRSGKGPGDRSRAAFSFHSSPPTMMGEMARSAREGPYKPSAMAARSALCFARAHSEPAESVMQSALQA
jgi:hypothetical protein